MTAQSPLAKMSGWPTTLRQASVQVLVADQPDLGCGHRLLDVSIQLMRAGLQFQRALRPASAQCQYHFDASGSSPDDAEWAALLGVLPLQERQCRLQRFDGDTGSSWP